MTRYFVFLAFFTILAAASYQFLPAKTWEWIPADRLVAHNYDDSMFEGDSSSSWIDNQALHLRCDIREMRNGAPPFCGLHIHLDNDLSNTIDLRGYHHMVIDAEYTGGNQKLRFYLSEFVPGFTDPNDPVSSRTAKYMGAYIDADETKAPFTVRMDEFIVAEWWINDSNVPRKYSLPSRERVLLFGMDISHPTALGHHEFKLKRVIFVGDWISAEHWYLALLLLWAASFLAFIFVRYYLLQRYTARLYTEKHAYQRLSMIDSLTQLMNRYGLTTYFDEKIKPNKTLGSSCLLLVDIDHFKQVNDNHGHPMGDVALHTVGSTIKEHLRQTDSASRWGGEEFLILLPATNLDHAAKLGERLRQVLADLSFTQASDLSITVSIGVCSFLPGESLESTFARADKALYQAKENGRDRVEMYSDE